MDIIVTIVYETDNIFETTDTIETLLYVPDYYTTSEILDTVRDYVHNCYISDKVTRWRWDIKDD